MAYRLEEDGSRVYLCEDHIPYEEKPDPVIPELRLVQPSQFKTGQG